MASVVGQAHCCSVVSVNNKNSVQLPTFSNSSDEHMSEREIAEMYDMVTAGGGMMGRKRGVPSQ